MIMESVENITKSKVKLKEMDHTELSSAIKRSAFTEKIKEIASLNKMER